MRSAILRIRQVRRYGHRSAGRRIPRSWLPGRSRSRNGCRWSWSIAPWDCSLEIGNREPGPILRTDVGPSLGTAGELSWVLVSGNGDDFQGLGHRREDVDQVDEVLNLRPEVKSHRR